MTDPYIGPIQHHESQTLECWCRHCVWWKEQAQKQERERLKVQYVSDALLFGWSKDMLAAILARLSDPEPQP